MRIKKLVYIAKKLMTPRGQGGIPAVANSRFFSRKLIAAASMGLIFMGAATTSSAQEPIKVRFGRLSATISTFRMDIAQQQGLFKKHGLDVETTMFRASPELNTAVVTGSIDIGFSSLGSVLTSRAKGLPLKGFFIDADTPYYYLLASPNISSLADAVSKGASVGVSGVGAGDYLVTRYIIQKAGLDPEKLKYVAAGASPSQRMAAVVAGRVDIANAGIPDVFDVLRKGNVKQIAKMADYSPHYAATTLWAQEDYIARNPEAIKRFLAAMDEASMWIRTSPDAAATAAKILNLTYPEAVEDVARALKEVSYPTVAEHKANLNELLAACEPLAADSLAKGDLKAENVAALVRQIMDLRFVQ